MTGNHYSHSKHLGSSLFEVLIVMAIVAILSALSLSSYHQLLRQRQLVQSVREVMAFLAYQQQRSLLFNCKVQIVLWLSPINKLEAKSLTTPTTKESIQLGLNNQLIRSQQHALHFVAYAKRYDRCILCCQMVMKKSKLLSLH